MAPNEIRRKTAGLLSERGIAIPSHLPPLDDDVPVRSLNETIDRMLCLTALGACAYGFDRERARRWLASEGVMSCLTASERAFLEKRQGRAEAFQMQIESLWVLAWSVSLVPSLDMDKPCDDSFVFVMPDLKTDESSQRIRARARQRPMAEILAACDLAYCLHWVIRDREVRGEPAPLEVEPFVIVERRRGLEWLISNDDWDEVNMDT